MISRRLKALIGELLTQHPAVVLVGSRQCGKTTIARHFAGHYFDLEQPEDCTRLNLQWGDIINGERPTVLDEAQTYPEIFPRLRGAIDRNRRRKGRFLLLGSVSPQLMKHVAQSLAGRMIVVDMSPFLLGEIGVKKIRRLWFYGGYPDGGILPGGDYPRWQSSYLRLLASRDLPAWGLPANSQTTARLFALLAAEHGGIWNASRIGARLGLSYHTVNNYLDYLDGAFLIRRLQPFYTNLGKRLSKRPKVYWRDSGLLHSLLKISDYNSLLGSPAVGASWEGFVIEQIINTLNATGRDFRAFYLRSDNRLEADLILDFGKELWAIEIKLTTSPSPADFKKLDAAADLIGAHKRILITQSKETISNKTKTATNLPHLLPLLT